MVLTEKEKIYQWKKAEIPETDTQIYDMDPSLIDDTNESKLQKKIMQG